MGTASGQDPPRIIPSPAGTGASGTRAEKDSLGEVEVPAGLQEAVGRTRNEEGTP